MCLILKDVSLLKTSLGGGEDRRYYSRKNTRWFSRTVNPKSLSGHRKIHWSSEVPSLTRHNHKRGCITASVLGKKTKAQSSGTRYAPSARPRGGHTFLCSDRLRSLRRLHTPPVAGLARPSPKGRAARAAVLGKEPLRGETRWGWDSDSPADRSVYHTSINSLQSFIHGRRQHRTFKNQLEVLLTLCQK